MADLRLLPDLIADGPAQMAADEALLECADQPSLRLYGWSRPTVSLGYFQQHAAIAAELARRDLAPAMVRRITGGGAIWHENEVTYALVGVLGTAGLPQRTADCYQLLHQNIRTALQRRGTVADLQASSVGDRRYIDEPRCFASPAACDVVARAGGKMLGSAARSRGSRVLIHGSLKLASNPWDEAAVSGCGLDWSDAAAAIREGIASALGLTLRAGDWTNAETAERKRVQALRYGDDAWLVRREGLQA
jgi:lipoyl(octanoyl) transferase